MSIILGFDAGQRGALGHVVKANVRKLLQDILMDEEGHAIAVAAGAFNFRQVFGRAMGAFFDGNRSQCDDLANSLFHFITTTWEQRHPGISASQWRDAYAPPSPLTEAEIDAGWELEIAGSESALRSMYEGSARVRKGNDLGSKRVH